MLVLLVIFCCGNGVTKSGNWVISPPNVGPRFAGCLQKAKGRFLLRDLALSVPIFGDPVLVPDHNACHPGIVRHPRATARAFTSLFHDHIRCKSFSNRRPFPVARTESRCRFSETAASPLSPSGSPDRPVAQPPRRCAPPAGARHPRDAPVSRPILTLSRLPSGQPPASTSERRRSFPSSLPRSRARFGIRSN